MSPHEICEREITRRRADEKRTALIKSRGVLTRDISICKQPAAICVTFQCQRQQGFVDAGCVAAELFCRFAKQAEPCIVV